MVNTTISITTPSDEGDKNGGGSQTAKKQSAIMVTPDGMVNNLLVLQPHQLALSRTTSRAAGYTEGSAGVNGAGGGVTIVNSQPVGNLATFHTGQLPATSGTVATAIVKSNNNAKKRALTTTLHQFLTDGNIDLQDLNGDYKNFTMIVAVPGTYMTKVAYGNGIRASCIGKVSPVAKKLLGIFVKGGGGLGLAHNIVLPQTLQDIIRV